MLLCIVLFRESDAERFLYGGTSMKNRGRRRWRVGSLLFAFFIFPILTMGVSDAEADSHYADYQLRENVKKVLSTWVMDVRWAKTVPDTAIAVYSSDAGMGVALLKYNPSDGLTVWQKNDQMIPRQDARNVSAHLDDHTPEYSIAIDWENPTENDYLTLQADDQENWSIVSLEYTVSGDQEDRMVFCHLSEDGKTAVISPLVDPRIEWPVDQEFSFLDFNLTAAQELCENAISILKDPERSGATDQRYRVVHAAMDRYEPEIPKRFDSEMNDEEQLLYLFREDRNGTIQTRWVFHWEEDKEAWILIRAEQMERSDTEEANDRVLTEWITEITADTVHTIKQLRDPDTQQILYTHWDVTYPNVLDQDRLLLKQFNFDRPPINAEGYNWDRGYGAYADPALLPALFDRFFPDDRYVDGYLQEDRTLMFILRNEKDDLVLRCGADEGENGWEWVDSSPLPEGTHFGDSNITDAVNMNAHNGGASVGVRRYGKGKWGLSYINSYDFFIGPEWVGMYGAETNAQFFGTHVWGDITILDWAGLPPEEFPYRETKEEKDARISAFVDRTDWATPLHSDPSSKTDLLKEAGDESSVIGSFYDGAPLFVLEKEEEWTKVRIGSGEEAGVMTGWMRTEELAFGDDTLHVSRETVRIQSEKILIHPVVPFAGSHAGVITNAQFSDCLVIGEAERDRNYAVVYDLRDGDVGLIPEDSLGNGNG